jgi:hypothetical protein
MNKAAHLDGIDDYISTINSVYNPVRFTLELWFKTNTTLGGKLIGLESSQTGISTNLWDRHIYMDDQGVIFFGVWPGEDEVLSSSLSYNDGRWHHVAASLTASGIYLYLDGELTDYNPDITSGENYYGYWRIGGGNLDYWPNMPSSRFFRGDIDDVRVWTVSRSANEIRRNMYDELSGDESRYLSYWNLNHSKDAQVTDQSEQNNHAVLRSGTYLITSEAPLAPAWLIIDPKNGAIPSHDSTEISLSYNIGDSYEGNYKLNLLISCNDPSNPYYYLPLFLEVQPSYLDELFTADIPRTYMLFQNYPNPFNPATQIRFGLPKAEKVVIELFNIIGQKIETLYEGNKSAGYHTINFNGDRYASGVYVYRMRTEGFTKSMKMLLIK